jgi:pyruvate/2-oxoglutarate dehydrogenase complex dihydrolipoamide acyltransferase (E2) component
VAYKVLREIRKDLPRFCGRRIALSVHPSVAEMLLSRARKAVARLGEELGREIEIRARPGQHQEQFEVVAVDAGPPVDLALSWLREPAPRVPAPAPAAPEPEPAAEAPESAAAPEEEAPLGGGEDDEIPAAAALPVPAGTGAEMLDGAGGEPILPPSAGREEI